MEVNLTDVCNSSSSLNCLVSTWPSYTSNANSTSTLYGIVAIVAIVGCWEAEQLRSWEAPLVAWSQGVISLHVCRIPDSALVPVPVLCATTRKQLKTDCLESKMAAGGHYYHSYESNLHIPPLDRYILFQHRLVVSVSTKRQTTSVHREK